MIKLHLDIIKHGIAKNYTFTHRIPAVDGDNYIDMLGVKATQVDIDSIWNKVKDVIEDTTNRNIILVFKPN